MSGCDAGPLRGVKIIEIAGIGPAPFCGMLLADLGADVLCVEAPGGLDAGLKVAPKFNLMNRGRRSVIVDLKSVEGKALVLDLASRADMLFEGFRPGVMERLGLGPNELLACNERLVYGRMTGWGQDGPLAHCAGHDLNYIGLSGALHGMGPSGAPPLPPLNLVGDFGAGGMLLAMGMLAAYIEAQRSGRGQVVDAAICDGAALMMTMFFGLKAAGMWTSARGANLLDGGCPWYASYQTADDRFICIGPVEPKFFRILADRLGLNREVIAWQYDTSKWPELRRVFSATFATRTRLDWQQLLEGTDACFAPVLETSELAEHPHLKARRTIVSVDGIDQPAPAPRFSRTPAAITQPPLPAGSQSAQALTAWGLDEGVVRRLLADGVVVQGQPHTSSLGAENA
jgi:alpha-methylacyl-CoA racemase